MSGYEVLSADNFDSFIGEDQISVLYFGATWCQPCVAFSQVFEQVALHYKGQIAFAKVDVDAQAELAQKLQVRSVPTIMIFHRSVAICQESGEMDKITLIDLIDQAKGLDFEKVHATIQEELAEEYREGEDD